MYDSNMDTKLSMCVHSRSRDFDITLHVTQHDLHV